MVADTRIFKSNSKIGSPPFAQSEDILPCALLGSATFQALYLKSHTSGMLVLRAVWIAQMGVHKPVGWLETYTWILTMEHIYTVFWYAH